MQLYFFTSPHGNGVAVVDCYDEAVIVADCETYEEARDINFDDITAVETVRELSIDPDWIIDWNEVDQSTVRLIPQQWYIGICLGEDIRFQAFRTLDEARGWLNPAEGEEAYVVRSNDRFGLEGERC